MQAIAVHRLYLFHSLIHSHYMSGSIFDYGIDIQSASFQRILPTIPIGV